MKDNQRCGDINECFYGAVTVGDRGQISIPVEARQELDIKAGDKLLVIKYPECSALLVAKLDSIKGCFDRFFEAASRVTEVEGEVQE